MTLTFVVSPEGSGVILANGNDVTGRSIVVQRGDQVQLHVDPNDGLELENWNEGESFDPDWLYQADQDATITCYLN